LPITRGGGVNLHGYDPNALGIRYATETLRSRGVPVSLHDSTSGLEAASFDSIVCTEVIEHASEPMRLLADMARLLKTNGRLVITTPIRLTESPEDPNHVQEWFPTEFRRLFDSQDWRVLSHEEVVPAAAVETYFWRPRMFLRVPVFRLLCNVLSICAGVNAMTWLKLRPRLYMMQIVVAERVSG
jgi:SAM-dependent methyltransferase